MQRTGQKEPLLQQAASSAGQIMVLRVRLLRTALGSLHKPWLCSSMVDLQPNPRKSVGIKKKTCCQFCFQYGTYYDHIFNMRPKHFICLKLWSSGMWRAYMNRNII